MISHFPTHEAAPRDPARGKEGIYWGNAAARGGDARLQWRWIPGGRFWAALRPSTPRREIQDVGRHYPLEVDVAVADIERQVDRLFVYAAVLFVVIILTFVLQAVKI